MIEISHLKKVYPAATPLKDVSVTVNDGEIISVIGPSGTGKSTLIRCINRLETPTAGKIFVDGEDITSPKCRLDLVRRKMGMVFQSFNLFEHLTVVENVMRPQVDLMGTPPQKAYDRAIELLRMVGLDGRALQYPHMLSGGQKQRVAIARTLSTDPAIILFDEPTSALDPTMVGEVEGVIRSLSKTGKTMLIVTHEMRFAREISTRVFYMDEGGIYEEGTPEEIFDAPKRERTRRFVRRLRVFEKEIEGEDHDFPDSFSLLSRFGFKNQIAPKTVYRLQTVFEELNRQLLLPNLEKKRVSFAAEYEETSGAVRVIARYPGAPFDPRDADNELALRMLSGLGADFSHTVICAEDGYTNCFSFSLRTE